MDTQETMLFLPVASVVPGEQGFHYRVALSAMLNKPKLTVDETTFTEFAGQFGMASHLHQKLAGHEVNGFVFKGWQDGPDGYMSSLWHRNLTAREASVNQTSLAGPAQSMERPWPNVLVYLGALEDPNTTIVIQLNGEDVEVPRLFDRVYLIPEGNYSCRVRKEVYVSTTGNFAPKLLLTDVPVPGRVQWAHRNLRGGLTCLHGRLVFEETQTGARKLMNWGTVHLREPAAAGRRLIMPPTNHSMWKTHCFDVNVTRSPDGQWVLTRLIAEPPAGFRKIRDLASR